MLLAPDQAKQYLKLMWGLQFFVNQQKQILPDVRSSEHFARLDLQEKIQVRDVLWENPELIDAYIKANPEHLTGTELSLIRKWKGFIKGQFFVFRYLKEYAVFIRDEQVYGVKGIIDPFDTLFIGRPLPIMIETVLLPFQGQIIYDGVVRNYSVFFGSGIRGNLKEEYMRAKQKGRILTSLEGDSLSDKSSSKINLSDSKMEELTEEILKESERLPVEIEKVIEEILKVCTRLKGGTPIQSATFGVLRTSIKLVSAAAQQPDDLSEIGQLSRKVYNALNRVWRAIEREEA